MNNLFFYSLLVSYITITSCNNATSIKSANTIKNSAAKGSYEYDLNFLYQFDSVVVLKSGVAEVIVSPKYQAKVFTSTANGNKGKSFGWINYKAFAAPLDPHMNAYGGENRFWLGPEGGKYSLYFPKGKEMVFENWKTPSPFDTEPWKVTAKDEQSVAMGKDMKLTNYAGTEIILIANRKISILSSEAIRNKTGVQLGDSIQVVGYQTDNSITNKGDFEWNEKTGMPCIWMLDMFNPSPKTVIVIPYKTAGSNSNSKIATTDYFGEISKDRIKYKNGVLLFKADGKSRGKLGIGPLKAKPVAGSYDSENRVLTVTLFDIEPSAKYLNQEWKVTKLPFSGDAVNAYNDGPLVNGSQLGPFYEIESVSPAAFLKPNAILSHQHIVLHFTGSEAQLNSISQKLLGISIAEIKKAFE